MVHMSRSEQKRITFQRKAKSKYKQVGDRKRPKRVYSRTKQGRTQNGSSN